MQPQDNTKTCYRRENRRTRQKISLRLSKSKPIHQRIKLEYINNKRPSKSSLSNVLKPSKLLLPTDFWKSCLLQLFRSRNNARLHPPSLTSFFWQISKASQVPKYSLSLNWVWVVFGYKSPLKVWQWERDGEKVTMISH